MQTIPVFPTQPWMQPSASMPLVAAGSCGCQCKKCRAEQQQQQQQRQLGSPMAARPLTASQPTAGVQGASVADEDELRRSRPVPRGRLIRRPLVRRALQPRPRQPRPRQPRSSVAWPGRWPPVRLPRWVPRPAVLPAWNWPVPTGWGAGTADGSGGASQGPAGQAPAEDAPQAPASPAAWTPASPSAGSCGVPEGFQMAEQVSLGLTTFIETGRSFACRVSPTSDPDGISMGMIQWNLRAKTLQTMIAQFERQGGNLQQHFGPVTPQLRSLLGMPQRTPEELHRMIEQARVYRSQSPAAWNRALLSLCADPIFCQLQMANIRGRMREARVATLRLGLTSVRGLAMLFDIQVGDGYAARSGNRRVAGHKIARFASRLAQEQSRLGRPLSEGEKLVAIAQEAANFAGRWSQERRERRMVIAQGTGVYRRSRWDLSRRFPQLDLPHGLN